MRPGCTSTASSAPRPRGGWKRRPRTASAGWWSSLHPSSTSSEGPRARKGMSETKLGINRIARRDFVKAGLIFGAGAGALAAGYAAVPDAFARAIYAVKRAGGRRSAGLVRSLLAGCNDVLWTVIPLQNPLLHDLRPLLAARSIPKAI